MSTFLMPITINKKHINFFLTVTQFLNMAIRTTLRTTGKPVPKNYLTESAKKKSQYLPNVKTAAKKRWQKMMIKNINNIESEFDCNHFVNIHNNSCFERTS